MTATENSNNSSALRIHPTIQAGRLAGKATVLIESASLVQSYMQLVNELVEENARLYAQINTFASRGGVNPGPANPAVPSAAQPVASQDRGDKTGAPGPLREKVSSERPNGP